MASPLSLEYHCALLSIVDADGRPILGYLEKLLAALKGNGISHLLVMGTTGEFPHFSVRQRQAYLEAVVQANEAHQLPLMVQVGASNLADTQALQAHALEQPGIDSLLVMPPFYFPQAETNGLAPYFETLLAHQPTNIPLLAYHYPQTSGIRIEADLLEAVPRLAGLKDSEGNFTRIQSLTAQFPNRQIYAGTDYQLISAQETGCRGIITGMANVVPHLIYSALKDPNKPKEQALKSLREPFKQVPKPVALKCILNLLGLWDQPTVPMLPMAPLSAQDSQALIHHVNQLLETFDDDRRFTSPKPVHAG